MKLEDVPWYQQNRIKEELEWLWNNEWFTREMLQILAGELLRKLREE